MRYINLGSVLAVVLAFVLGAGIMAFITPERDTVVCGTVGGYNPIADLGDGWLLVEVSLPCDTEIIGRVMVPHVVRMRRSEVPECSVK